MNEARAQKSATKAALKVNYLLYTKFLANVFRNPRELSCRNRQKSSRRVLARSFFLGTLNSSVAPYAYNIFDWKRS